MSKDPGQKTDGRGLMPSHLVLTDFKGCYRFEHLTFLSVDADEVSIFGLKIS